jgi:hypothetical protein
MARASTSNAMTPCFFCFQHNGDPTIRSPNCSRPQNSQRFPELRHAKALLANTIMLRMRNIQPAISSSVAATPA